MAKEAEELAEQAGRIAELRDQKGRQEGRRIPQPEVADAVGVTLRAYQAWEGGRSDLDRKNLKALADYFGVSTDFIEYGEERLRGPAPDPFASRNGYGEQLDRIEGLLNDLLDRLDSQRVHEAVAQEPPPVSGTRRAARHRPAS